MWKKIKTYKWYIFIAGFFLSITIFVITFFSIFSIITVQGLSMAPTLVDGQVLLVNKTKYDFKFFDIVVFQWNDRLLVKRIVGLPGDTIQFKNNKIYRNGDVISTPFYDKLEDTEDTPPIIIPKDNYFVLGDNINESTDSRIISWIPKDKIYGTKA